MRRRLEKALDSLPEYETGALLDAHGQSYAAQLARTARAENHAPDQDDATAGLVIADGALLDVDE